MIFRLLLFQRRQYRRITGLFVCESRTWLVFTTYSMTTFKYKYLIKFYYFLLSNNYKGFTSKLLKKTYLAIVNLIIF